MGNFYEKNICLFANIQPRVKMPPGRAAPRISQPPWRTRRTC